MKISVVGLLVLSISVSGRHGHGRTHSYPHSHGGSGHGYGTQTHTYPASNGLSGTSNRGSAPQYYHHQQNYSPKTEVHNHYHYNPPQHISYGSTYHPVYHGTPPVYIYEYRNSGSRFDTLLTGLALYNLGRSQSHHYEERHYSRTPGELCKLGISYRDGRYEETRISCELMSSFIWENPSRNDQHAKEVTEVRVTQVNNGNNNLNGNSSVMSVTVKTEVVDALKDRGPSIPVTPGMTCYMIRMVGGITAIRKPVDCGLLQEYARSSMYRASGSNISMPLINILFITFIYFIVC